LMYHKITHFPSPKGILKLANHNRKFTQTRCLYGHSYSAPTPTINTPSNKLDSQSLKPLLFISATRGVDFSTTLLLPLHLTQPFLSIMVNY
jgi:hypothetical protein